MEFLHTGACSESPPVPTLDEIRQAVEVLQQLPADARHSALRRAVLRICDEAADADWAFQAGMALLAALPEPADEGHALLRRACFKGNPTYAAGVSTLARAAVELGGSGGGLAAIFEEYVAADCRSAGSEGWQLIHGQAVEGLLAAMRGAPGGPVWPPAQALGRMAKAECLTNAPFAALACTLAAQCAEEACPAATRAAVAGAARALLERLLNEYSSAVDRDVLGILLLGEVGRAGGRPRAAGRGAGGAHLLR